jgi:hypothetical protein
MLMDDNHDRQTTQEAQSREKNARMLDRDAQASLCEEIARDTGLHITAVRYACTTIWFNVYLRDPMSPDYIAAVRVEIIKQVHADMAAFAVREKAYQKKRRAELKEARRSGVRTPPTRTQPARRRGGGGGGVGSAVVAAVGRGCPLLLSNY